MSNKTQDEHSVRNKSTSVDIYPDWPMVSWLQLLSPCRKYRVTAILDSTALGFSLEQKKREEETA